MIRKKEVICPVEKRGGCNLVAPDNVSTLGVADTEAHHYRQIGVPSQSLDVGADVGGQLLSRPRYSGNHNIVDKARSVLEDLAGPPLMCGGSNQRDKIHIILFYNSIF